MVGIISSGIGSGLDIQGLVRQLVEAEVTPASTRLTIRETQFQSQLSAYGSLRGGLDNLKDAFENLAKRETVSARSISTSNEDAVTLTVNEEAVPASYDVSIVSKATSARLTSASFADSEATVGTGTLTISLGAESFDVEVDAESNTLAGIRDAINGASDNTGVQATIINADAGSFLVLSGAQTGAANTITVTQADGDGGLSALVYDPANTITNLTETQAASDAAATVNGFDVFSETNEFSDVIDGVTFSALIETEESFTIDVSNDVDSLRNDISRIVSGYNALVDSTNNLSSFDSETNIAGPLQGDTTLRNIVSQLRQELSSATVGADPDVDTLNEIGITLDETGKLVIDDERLSSVLNTDFSAIDRLFSGDQGYAARINGIIDGYIGTDGILTSRSEGIEASIESINTQRERLDARLVSLEARLTRQFNGLDSLLAQLNTTSSFLTAQLANVPTP